jgi:Flp pilus assembly protein TadG
MGGNPGVGLIRLAGREHGASAVEFAIVASLLFMIVFGTVQFGIAYNRYQGLNAGAREGGRLASINASRDDVVTRTKEATSIIDTTSTNHVDNCATIALAVDASCVGIQYLDTGNVYQNYTNAMASGSGALTPCDKAGSINTANPTVKVLMRYRMRIQIPFVGNMTPTITGDSIFRCER